IFIFSIFPYTTLFRSALVPLFISNINSYTAILLSLILAGPLIIRKIWIIGYILGIDFPIFFYKNNLWICFQFLDQTFCGSLLNRSEEHTSELQSRFDI